MLSAGRRTIVRWLEDDRSPTNGQSFAARRTTYRLYPNNELIPSKKMTDLKENDKRCNNKSYICINIV